MIYLGPNEDPNHDFLGAMLTRSGAWGNILLKKAHFEESDPSRHPWQITFNLRFGSFIADDLFRKLVDWSPFSKVGQLTPEGLAFVRQQLDGHLPRYAPWNEPPAS